MEILKTAIENQHKKTPPDSIRRRLFLNLGSLRKCSDL